MRGEVEIPKSLYLGSLLRPWILRIEAARPGLSRYTSQGDGIYAVVGSPLLTIRPGVLQDPPRLGYFQGL